MKGGIFLLFDRRKRSPDAIRQQVGMLSESDMAKQVIEHVTSGFNVARLNMCERGEISREEFACEVKEYIRCTYNVPETTVTRIYERFSRFLWSYYIIDELINDADISDIRITDAFHVYVKKKGVRSLSRVRFDSPKDYERFIERVVLKNKINMGNNNAISVFTDRSLKDWILRFNLSTRYVLSGDVPMLHIRKHPRKKKLLGKLVSEGMLSNAAMELIRDKVAAGESFLICGAGSVGKTTLMNALIEVIPEKYSIFCVQEAEELFSMRDREFFAYHIVENRGDGKINYSLEDISKNGLLIDSDVYMVGEIKGREAKDFLYAVHTGAICYASIHANSPEDAYFRLVDYVKRGSSHSTGEILFMLRSLRNCIFLSDYRVRTIAEVKWSDAEERLKFITLYSEVSDEA